MCAKYYGLEVQIAWYSTKTRVIFSVCMKDKTSTKKQIYMKKTERCIFCSWVFWIFPPNVIKINPYNFELYRFKVGSFLTQDITLPLGVIQVKFFNDVHVKEN